MSKIFIIVASVIIIAVIIIIVVMVLNNKSKKTNKSKESLRFKGYDVSPKMNIAAWKIAQSKMTGMMKVFVDICNKHDINNWWVAGGTLIGVVRHKGWIPWDGDIDLSMMEDDYERFKKIVQSELPSTMLFQSHETDKLYTVKGMPKIRDKHSCYKHPKRTWKWHSGLQIDIFLYKEKDNKVVPIVWNTDIKTYDKNFVLPAKKMSFEGIDVNVPNQYSAYLKSNFGKEIPDLPLIEKRIPHEGGGNVDPENTCDYHYTNYPLIYKK